MEFFALIGFVFLFGFGFIMTLKSLLGMYVVYAFSGKFEYWFLIPLVVGLCIVYGSIVYMPFDFSFSMKAA